MPKSLTFSLILSSEAAPPSFKRLEFEAKRQKQGVSRSFQAPRQRHLLSNAKNSRLRGKIRAFLAHFKLRGSATFFQTPRIRSKVVKTGRFALASRFQAARPLPMLAQPRRGAAFYVFPAHSFSEAAPRHGLLETQYLI
jgi:hypothetical protein